MPPSPAPPSPGGEEEEGGGGIFTSLPHDIFLQVVAQLSPGDLLRAAGVNRAWGEKLEPIFKERCKYLFDVSFFFRPATRKEVLAPAIPSSSSSPSLFRATWRRLFASMSCVRCRERITQVELDLQMTRTTKPFDESLRRWMLPFPEWGVIPTESKTTMKMGEDNVDSMWAGHPRLVIGFCRHCAAHEVGRRQSALLLASKSNRARGVDLLQLPSVFGFKF